MSMCNGCGAAFPKAIDVQLHAKNCDGFIIGEEAPTYRDFLENAAKKNPIYSIYLNRIDPAVPNGSGDPLRKQRLQRRLVK